MMMNKEYIRSLPVGLIKRGQAELLPMDTGIKPFNQGNNANISKTVRSIPSQTRGAYNRAVDMAEMAFNPPRYWANKAKKYIYNIQPKPIEVPYQQPNSGIPRMVTNKDGVKIHDVDSFNIPRYRGIATERNKDILNNIKAPGLLDRLKGYSNQAREWANKQNPWHLGLGAAGVVGGGLLLSDLLRRRRRRRDD